MGLEIRGDDEIATPSRRGITMSLEVCGVEEEIGGTRASCVAVAVENSRRGGIEEVQAKVAGVGCSHLPAVQYCKTFQGRARATPFVWRIENRRAFASVNSFAIGTLILILSSVACAPSNRA